MHKRIIHHTKGGVSRSLLKVSFAASLLSTLIFILCSNKLGLANMCGISGQWLYVVAHVLGGFGVGILLWPIVNRREPDTGRKDIVLLSAVIAIVVYHLAAAVAYAMSFDYRLYLVILILWWLKTALAFFIAFEFIVCRRSDYTWAGISMIIAYVAGCPYSLPDTFGILQWIIAKMATVVLAILLYRCAKRYTYN